MLSFSFQVLVAIKSVTHLENPRTELRPAQGYRDLCMPPGPRGGLFSRFLDSMPLLFDTLPGYTNTVHFMDPFSPGERLPAIDARPRECYTWRV